MPPTNDETHWTALRETLARARSALPPAASAYTLADPRDAASVISLADFEESMEQYEFEMALYSLVGIAKAVGAGPAFWAAAEEAARLMAMETEWRTWEFPA